MISSSLESPGEGLSLFAVDPSAADILAQKNFQSLLLAFHGISAQGAPCVSSFRTTAYICAQTCRTLHNLSHPIILVHSAETILPSSQSVLVDPSPIIFLSSKYRLALPEPNLLTTAPSANSEQHPVSF